VVTGEEVEREASRYLLHKLGDRLWAGEPFYDDRREQWNVPIHSRSLPADVVLGQIILDARGIVVRAPSRRALQGAVQRHQPATHALAPLSVSPSAREDSEAGQGLAPPDLPEDPQVIGQELLADPDTRRAYRYLKLALSDPQMRPTVIEALETFARAARPETQK
jgi:hypothetical protein